MNEQARRRARIIRTTLTEIEGSTSSEIRIPVASVEWAKKLEQILIKHVAEEWSISREATVITLRRFKESGRIVLLH